MLKIRDFTWRRIRHLGSARVALLSVFVVAYSLSLFLWVIVPRLYRFSVEWEPYHTVITDRDPAEATRLLAQAGIDDAVTEVISEHTTEVLITRFSHLESVALSEALRQLDIRDPRRDPFISELSRYFSSGTDGQSILYLRMEGGRWQVARFVRRVLGEGSRIVGWVPARLAVGLTILIVAGVVVASRSSPLKLIIWAGFVVWIPAVVGAGISGAVASGVICIAWGRSLVGLSIILEKNDRAADLIALRLVVWPLLVILASFAVVWNISGIRAAMTLLPGVAGLSAVTAVAYLFRFGGSIRRDHPLFAPVLILYHRSRSSAANRSFRGTVFATFLIGFLVIPPFADRLATAGSQMVPMQVALSRSEGITYESINTLWSTDLPRALVDLSDYMAHRAYQQSLAFGRGYAPPFRDEAVTLSRFREDDTGAYIRYSENVVVFDDQWLNDAIDNAPVGIAAMLASLGGARGVVLAPDLGLYSGYPQLLIHTAFVFLALLPEALSGRRLPRVGRGRSKVVEIVRRRKRVA